MASYDNNDDGLNAVGEIDLNVFSEQEDTGGCQAKSCGHFGACDCDEEDHGGSHDGHNHDAIVRYYTQTSLGEDGSIIAAETMTGTSAAGSGVTFNNTGPQDTWVVSSATEGNADLASGNLSITLNNTGGAEAGTDARAAFEQAVELWTYLLGDNINLTLDVGFQALNPGVLGSTGSETVIVSYSDVRAALIADATSAEDTSSSNALANVASLSFIGRDVNGNLITDNDGGNNNTFLSINTATAKAMGLTQDVFGNPINPAADGQVTFSTAFSWDFDPTDGIDAGKQDFVGVAFHEIGHALGFTSGVDTVDFFHGSGAGAPQDLSNNAVFKTLDLFRYSAAGQLNFAYGGTPYFSLDGGVTSTTTFSTGRAQGDGQQASHWKDGLGIGIMDPTANPSGNVNVPSNLDLIAFDVMGYDRLVDNLVFGDETGQTNDGTNLRDLIDGKGGDDTLRGFGGEDRLVGRTGDDFLNGGGGDDILEGGENDDLLLGGAGGDLLDGGTNDADGDTASYSNSGSAVNVNLGADTASGGDAEGDELNNIENLFGSVHNDTLTGDGNANTINGSNGNDIINGGGGNDNLIGGVGIDTIDGGDGDDTIEGGSGNDTFIAGIGADSHSGGTGIDTIDYSGSTAGITIRLDGVAAGTGGTAEGDTFVGTENAIGSSMADSIVGSIAGNVIDGGDGDDVINSSNGSDTINGGAGDDTLIGGASADNLNGGTNTSVGDTASYSNSTIAVQVDLQAGTATGGFAQGDVLTGIENLFGSNLSDTLTGNSLDNTLTGGNGNDILNGGAGNDRLNGNRNSDTLNGGANDDVLVGGDGLDFLNGGTGNDTLIGGNDGDRYIFTDLLFGQDTINGWQNSLDLLDFTALGLDENDFTITQSGADTLITLTSNTNHFVRLVGIQANTINGADFVDIPPMMIGSSSIEAAPDADDNGGYMAFDGPVEDVVVNDGGGYLADDGVVESAEVNDPDGGYQATDGLISEVVFTDPSGGYRSADDPVADVIFDDPDGGYQPGEEPADTEESTSGGETETDTTPFSGSSEGASDDEGETSAEDSEDTSTGGGVWGSGKSEDGGYLPKTTAENDDEPSDGGVFGGAGKAASSKASGHEIFGLAHMMENNPEAYEDSEFSHFI